MLAELTLNEANLLSDMLIGIVVIAVCAALAYYGLRAVGQPVWGSRVAGFVIGLGAVLLLLMLL